VKNSLGSNWPQRTPTLNFEWGQTDPKGNRRVKHSCCTTLQILNTREVNFCGRSINCFTYLCNLHVCMSVPSVLQLKSIPVYLIYQHVSVLFLPNPSGTVSNRNVARTTHWFAVRRNDSNLPNPIYFQYYLWRHLISLWLRICKQERAPVKPSGLPAQSSPLPPPLSPPVPPNSPQKTHNLSTAVECRRGKQSVPVCMCVCVCVCFTPKWSFWVFPANDRFL